VILSMRTSGRKVDVGHPSRSGGSCGATANTVGRCGCCRLLLPLYIDGIVLTTCLQTSGKEVNAGHCRSSLPQLIGRSQSYEVGTGRQGCCIPLLYH
jgi:hypothetical protein